MLFLVIINEALICRSAGLPLKLPLSIPYYAARVQIGPVLNPALVFGPAVLPGRDREAASLGRRHAELADFGLGL